jgi:hypothetical protein
MDVTEAHVYFHTFGKGGKVMLIANEPTRCGLNRAVLHFQEAIEQEHKKKISARTSDDGIRLGCILLDSQYRETVSGMMTNKKNRKKCDIAGDPTIQFF